MNTNALARQYQKLTPAERLALILAASARGDDQERDRLAMSAPRVLLRVPDHFGVALAFREVGEQHFMELLNLAANYFQALGFAGCEKGKAAERLLDLGLFFGYLLKGQLAGWRQFCAEHHFEPELCWTCRPGLETVRRAEKLAESAAFTQEGAARYLERRGEGPARVPTAEAVAAGLRECLRARAEWWG